jgi:hypothetical protein
VSALSFNARQIHLPKLHNCFTFVMLTNCNNDAVYRQSQEIEAKVDGKIS